MNPIPKFSKVHIINTLVLLNKVVQNSRTFHSLLPLISYHHEKTMTFHVTLGLVCSILHISCRETYHAVLHRTVFGCSQLKMYF